MLVCVGWSQLFPHHDLYLQPPKLSFLQYSGVWLTPGDQNHLLSEVRTFLSASVLRHKSAGTVNPDRGLS